MTQCPLGRSNGRSFSKMSPIAEVYVSKSKIPKSLGSCEYCSIFPSCSLFLYRLDLFFLFRLSKLAYGGDVQISPTDPSSRYMGIFRASSSMAICLHALYKFLLPPNLFSHSEIYSCCKSNPTAFLFTSLAANNVLPLPTKGSTTSSPSCVNNSITFVHKLTGNVAG